MEEFFGIEFSSAKSIFGAHADAVHGGSMVVRRGNLGETGAAMARSSASSTAINSLLMRDGSTLARKSSLASFNGVFLR